MFMKEEKKKIEYEAKLSADAENGAVGTSEKEVADESVEVHEEEENEPQESAADNEKINSEDVDGGDNLETKEVAKLIEEAESRGYLRGRNEKIEELMSAPGMYRPLGIGENCAPGLPTTEILTNVRRSVWD